MSDQLSRRQAVSGPRRQKPAPGRSSAGLRPLQLPARDTAILDAIAGFIRARGLEVRSADFGTFVVQALDPRRAARGRAPS